MIALQPKIDFSVRCLQCNELVSIGDIFFQGIHVLADCDCRKCNVSFYHTLPVGHDLLFPIAFTKDGSRRKYEKDSEIWLANPLIKSMTDSDFKKSVHLSVQKRSDSMERAIIINCLDSCFGHAFTKLWNIIRAKEKYPDYAVIVLVSVNMVWLVPAAVDEVWVLNGKMHDLRNQLVGVDGFIKEQLKRFTSVWISHTYTHLDERKIDLFDFLKIKRFELNNYAKIKYQITFVLREDRFWHPNQVEQFIFFLTVKFRMLNKARRFFCWRQNRLVRKTAHLISRELGDVSFILTGIGKMGMMRWGVSDERVTKINYEVEMEWSKLYSESHIVIGVHGSNMLIPSALAAGFIEILPDYKIRHVAESTLQPYDNRLSQFLGRHVPGLSSPKRVARHAVSMIKDFPYLYRNQQEW